MYSLASQACEDTDGKGVPTRRVHGAPLEGGDICPDVPTCVLAGFDITHKELYLGDDEFLKIFKKDKETFATLPQWKQNRAKKKHGLF